MLIVYSLRLLENQSKEMGMIKKVKKKIELRKSKEGDKVVKDYQKITNYKKRQF